MKQVLLTLAFAAGITPALAIDRYEVADRSCAEAQAIVERDGAAILRSVSRVTNVPVYDRYVNTAASCQAGEVVELDSILTADDDRCTLYKCVTPRYLDAPGAGAAISQ